MNEDTVWIDEVNLVNCIKKDLTLQTGTIGGFSECLLSFIHLHHSIRAANLTDQ